MWARPRISTSIWLILPGCRRWAREWVLPNHGAAEVIAAGGYGPGLLAATADYIRHLQADDPRPMADIIAPWLHNGTLRYFEPYEAVHAQNRAPARGDGSKA